MNYNVGDFLLDANGPSVAMGLPDGGGDRQQCVKQLVQDGANLRWVCIPATPAVLNQAHAFARSHARTDAPAPKSAASAPSIYARREAAVTLSGVQAQTQTGRMVPSLSALAANIYEKRREQAGYLEQTSDG